MDTPLSNMDESRKKALTIIVSIVLIVIVTIIVSVTLFFTGTEKGKEIQSQAERQFSVVEIPEDSSQLTYVPDAPVNRPDKSTDKNNGVDLLGNTVIRDTPSPSSSSSSSSRRSSSTPQRQGNSPQGNTQSTSAHSSRPIPPRRPTAEDMQQVSNIGERVKIPSLKGDFSLGKLREPESGIIEPTNFTSVFWITNRGVKYDNTAQGTAYLAAHALDLNEEGSGLSGLAPGNWLYDPFTKKSKLNPGDILEVGGVKFKYVSSQRAGKGLIARDKEIWDGTVPNRLVYITCLNNSNDNFVAFFEKV